MSSNINDSSQSTSMIEHLERIKEILFAQTKLQEHTLEIRNNITSNSKQAAVGTRNIQDYLSVIRMWGSQARRLSLNSIIKANKLEDGGDVLAVLSQEIVKQSQVLQGIVQSIEDYIVAIELSIDTIVDVKIDQSENSSIDLDLQKLDERYSNFQKTRDETTSLIKSLIVEITTSQNCLIFIEELQNNLCKGTDFLGKAQNVLEMIAPECKDMNEISTEILEKFSQKYTMDEERKIHEKYFGKFSEKKATSDSSTPLDSSEDDFEMFPDDTSDEDVKLFGDDDEEDNNVELFGDEDDSNIELFGDEDEEDSNVELFGDEDEEDSNVELFGDEDEENSNVEQFGDDEKITPDDNNENFEQFRNTEENEEESSVELFEETSEDNTLDDNIELF